MIKLREVITAKIVAHLRFYWIILFLKKFQKIKFIRKLTKYFDPNWLRKISGFSYSPLIKIISWNNFKLYVDLNDHIGFRSFIKNEPFEMSVFHVAKTLRLNQNDCILDIGANIGHASIPICKKLSCSLIAVEASKENASLLLKNINLNNIKAEVHVSALVSSKFKQEYIKLYIRNGNRGANSLLEKWNPSFLGDHYEWAPCMTLDNLLNNVTNSKKIKLIKIDVEGMEYEVLKGGINFIKKSKIPILMEYRLDKNIKTKLKKILLMLKKIYNIHGIDKIGKKTVFNPDVNYENILFERKKNYSRK
ncbi:MAG: hypothetical protein CMI74_09555 [Candidatus Pelagibacter sp.]|nr:hypothetical protein [Candidatus Pelagibacter sp.]|tara:strand:- start:1383 stop:2300 length:918 start_codon:yes stop_codon:yes gene_type:complete